MIEHPNPSALRGSELSGDYRGSASIAIKKGFGGYLQHKDLFRCQGAVKAKFCDGAQSPSSSHLGLKFQGLRIRFKFQCARFLGFRNCLRLIAEILENLLKHGRLQQPTYRP